MTDMKRDPAMTGGCRGAVRYALLSEPTHASICHCSMCQKAFGNYFGAAHRGAEPRSRLDQGRARDVPEFGSRWSAASAANAERR